MSKNEYQKKFQGNVKTLGRVAVLYGGNSAEREISLQSGSAVLDTLRDAGVDAFGVDISKDVLKTLSDLECDRAFIALHGVGGEDGRMQALLEWMEIPFTGSDVGASALAMNKLRTKLVWQGLGLPTPDFEVLSEDMDFSQAINRLGGACFVKPVNEGSSIGMRCVDSASELKDALLEAKQFDSEVIAEARIVGREFTVAILNGQGLPAIELRTNNTFYDYEAKYLSDDTQYICPCDLSEAKQQELQALALSAFDSLGCEGWGRVDFMQAENGDFYLLEANTVPGMTSHSLVPMAAKAAGLSFCDLLKEILVNTL